MADDLRKRLLPCPFCGSPGKTHFQGIQMDNRWAVGCSAPGCFIMTCDFLSEPEAVTAWNTRTPAADALSAQAGEGLREKVAELIHEWAFNGEPAWSEAYKAKCREDALTKADAVLSLLAPAAGGEGMASGADSAASLAEGKPTAGDDQRKSEGGAS